MAALLIFLLTSLETSLVFEGKKKSVRGERSNLAVMLSKNPAEYIKLVFLTLL